MPNLVTVSSLSPVVILAILEKARSYAAGVVEEHQITKHLAGRVAANLFFEPSTRTLNAFELAEMRHAMLTLSPALANSALVKGESAGETLLTLEAMGADLFVIRHADAQFFDQLEAMQLNAHVINAGCGHMAHPTQALIDLQVILAHKENLSDLCVAIIGDVRHSRVARSQIRLFEKMGVGSIRVIAPQSLHMEEDDGTIEVFEDMNAGLEGADVIICLRLQQERFAEHFNIDVAHYIKEYCLTMDRLAYAKPDAIVMHPGPCLMEIDMTSDVAQSKRCVILEQVRAAVPLRMALIDYVFGVL